MSARVCAAGLIHATSRTARVAALRIAGLLSIAALCGSGVGRADGPPLPSSRFGAVEVAGSPALAGTIVSAHVAGREIAAASVFIDSGSRYRLDVPGDLPETPEVEGPTPGQTFEIRVAGAPAATPVWAEGTFTALDLAATAGPDLGVAIDDGEASVIASQVLTLTLSAQNLGTSVANGIQLIASLPAGSTLLAASDGGLFSAGAVSWPIFSLAPTSAAQRTLTLRLPAEFGAGVETVVAAARISHDGATGGDPQPANDEATDVDALAASPNLVVMIDDDNATVEPGATVIQRVRVTNSGTQDATGVAVAIDLPAAVVFYSASHGGSFAAGTVTFPVLGLAAGATLSRAMTIRIPADLPATTSEIEVVGRAQDDGANGVDPTPADNTASDLDTVFHAPDLTADGVNASAAPVDPQTLAISGLVTVELANRGTIVAGASTLTLFEDLDGNGAFSRAADRLLGESPVGAMPAGGTLTLDVAVDGLLEVRDDRIFAAVDADGAVVELDEENNVSDSGSACAAPGNLVDMSPVVELSWPPADSAVYEPLSVDSLSTPIVVQLTDDNGDGRWDEKDVPDVVFVTANLAPTFPPEPDILLRAIRGDSGEALWNVPGFFTIPVSFISLCGLAAGDIDGDGRPEIVTTVVSPDGYGFLQAYEHNGLFKWRSETYDTHPFGSGTSNRDNPSLADLDGDGDVEIVVGAYVFDSAGYRLWAGTGGQAYQTQRNNQVVGGAISVVADVDLDGLQEVVTGNTLYRFDGAIAWQRQENDGYPAVLNADDDPQAEIVVVAQGFIRLHDTDGALIWGPLEMPGSDPESGGPPAVGDLDGDGEPEIVVAGSDVLWALHLDGTPLWQASTRDYSSSQTGATLFDFDGDGAYEVVYRDERRLRLYRGVDGAVLFEHVLSSTTMTETPVVADVDRDGNAEILVTSDHAWDYPVPGGERTAGLRIIGDANDGWVRARPIWNQHAYSIGNIGEDGGIPARPEWSWLAHQTFRANAGPAGAELASSDVSVGRLLVDLAALPVVRVSVRIGNAGPTPLAPGLAVALFDGATASPENLRATGSVPVALAPGAYVDFTLTFNAGAALGDLLTVVADSADRERECNESNNLHSAGVDASALGLWLTKSDGTTAVAPGDIVTYELAVHNAYLGTATGVALADSLPAGLLFLAASDGGVEAAGVITWPPFALASGTVATRTVTAQVDPTLALGVTSLANTATVADDGSNGTDPTPANNQAIDTDLVVSVIADAGGPYGGVEGEGITFDGIASVDRDGGTLLYAWDLDGDGAFDDGSGASATRAFEDEGAFIVRLRVTDDEGEVDLDEAPVTIGNVTPSIVAPQSIVSTEGGRVGLSGFLVSDPGSADALTATVDWGDGPVEAVTIVAGLVVGEHVYPEDGAFTIELCVDDGDGGSVCAVTPAVIANEAPQLRFIADLGFTGWQREEFRGGATTTWTVAADGRSVTQRRNGQPAFFLGDLPGYGSIELDLRVSDNADDDFIGLAIGFEAGDTARTTAEYLLIDWKRLDQTGARRGLALSRVVGIPSPDELWVHQNLGGNGTANRVDELQRGALYGSMGWAGQTGYRLRVESTPARLRLFVDGRLELDYLGPVPNGGFALYDCSQGGAVFGPGAADHTLSGREGDPVQARIDFSDAGVLDTHAATLDWGDGTSSPGEIAEEEGHGEVLGQHVYGDDGDSTLVACVTDDEGDTACADIQVAIANVAPTLAFVVQSTGFLEDAVTLGGSSFTDPGVLDTHQVEVDWGDGAVETVPPSGGAGSWSFGGSHLYAMPGGYTVVGCVTDDDGAETCATRALSLVPRLLDLEVTMSVLPIEARPGQNVVFTLQVRNAGTVPATGVVLTDLVPPHLTYVSSTLGGTPSGGSVAWNLGALAPGAQISPALTLRVAPTAPFRGTVTNEGQVTDDGASGPDSNPANNLGGASLRFSDAYTPIVTIAAPWSGAEGALLTLSGVTWNDTSVQYHSASTAWGDGQTTWMSFIPSSGSSGAVNSAHVYVDDGVYEVEICVYDSTNRVSCNRSTATILNLPADVLDSGEVSLKYWIEEEYETEDVSALWTVAADGLSVLQSFNSQPSIYFSQLPGIGSILEGAIRVEPAGNWDDDYVGFVFGFESGDSLDPSSEFLLVDWKQGNQGYAHRGLAVSRALGAIGGEFWGHVDWPQNGAGTGVFELARAATLGDTGWVDNREYRFRFEIASDRLKIWVDGVQQFDLAVTVPPGRFGFYNYSQQAVRYRGFTVGLHQRYEGESFELLAPFTDSGVLDQHTATIDWDDGATEAAAAATDQGFGTVLGSHAYPDDGDFRIETCVEDDDGAGSCGVFPLLVLNRPPEVSPAPDGVGYARALERFALATFTDPGVLDTHLATVDWGDGEAAAAEVVDDDGAGEVSASHAYAAPGSYPVAVCVTDDDGASACVQLTITVEPTPPALRAEKIATVVDRDGDGLATPGDDIVYRIELYNDGDLTATAVRLIDPAPAHTTLVPGSIFPELGVVGTDPLTIEVDPVAPGTSTLVQFAVTIANPLPAGVSEIVNSGSVTSAEMPPVPTDDPTRPGRTDPTRTPVFASPGLAASKTALLVDLDGDGVATPGDEIQWTLLVRASGDTDAGGVLVQDQIGPHLGLVPSSLSAPGGQVLSIAPIAIVYETIPVGGSVELSLRTVIDAGLPPEIETVSNQATVLATQVDAFLSDDPATPVTSDPTVVPVYVFPVLTIAGTSVLEGGSGVTPVSFAVTLDRPARLAVDVAWALEGVSAVAGEDFVAASGTLTIPVGSSSGEIVVQALGDLVVEGDELLRVVLSSPLHAELASSEAIATLVNDDATALSVSDASVEEGGAAVFTLQLSAPSAFPVTVSVATLEGSATAGADYISVSGAVTLAPLETFRTIAVETLQDLVDEPEENLFLELSAAVGAAISDASGTGTIVDDEFVELAIEPATVIEGNDGDVDLAFRLYLSAPTYETIEVDVASVAGSATEGADFAGISGRFAIPAGEAEAWVVVPVHGDLADETDETLRVVLANAAGATLLVTEAIGTIVDDDEAATECLGPNLLVNGGAEVATEGCEVPGWIEKEGDWWVRRLPADPLPEDGVAYFAGRAGAHDDDDDDDSEGDGDLWRASGGSGQGSEGDEEEDDLTATPGDLHGDDDECGGEDDDDLGPFGGEHGDDEDCYAELAQTVDVGAFVARIDAGEQELNFAAAMRTELGASFARVRIAVEYLASNGSTVLDRFDTGWLWSDGAWEPVADVRSAPFGTRQIRVRLLVDGDGDEALGYFDSLVLQPIDTTVLSARDLFEPEGQSGSHDALVPLDVDCPGDFAIELDYLTANGSARAPGDYLTRSGSIPLPPGAVGTSVPVPIVGDTVAEPNESFDLRFSPGDLGDAVLFDPVSTVTILDDDFCRRSPGYWKTHRSAWPVDHLTLGAVEYDDDAMMDFLDFGGPDGATRLGRHLVATKLNLAKGSHLWIQPTVTAADLFLVAHPPGSAPSGAALTEANAIKDLLDSYNNSGCQVP